MPYATGRIIHDADAHIMETPTWLRDHAEPRFRDDLPVLTYPGGNELRQTGSLEEQRTNLVLTFDRLRERHASAEYRAVEDAEIMARKNFAATGSFVAEDRPRRSISWASEVSLCSTRSTTGACMTSSTVETSTSPTLRPGPITGECLSSAP